MHVCVCKPNSYAEEAFTAASEKVQAMLKKVGYPPKAVAIVPVSGFMGENLTAPSAKVLSLTVYCRICWS
jgi:translation elongation factor EF-1alpha